ncbi:MAG: GTP-binding protein [Polyangiaceae bacterium]
MGSGKTALVLALCRALRDRMLLGVVTNDIFTREDAEFLMRHEALPLAQIRVTRPAVACTRRSARQVSPNLHALEDLMARVRPELLIVESGGDNLAAQYSRELVDYTIYVIDVAGETRSPARADLGSRSRSARHQQDGSRAARRGGSCRDGSGRAPDARRRADGLREVTRGTGCPRDRRLYRRRATALGDRSPPALAPENDASEKETSHSKLVRSTPYVRLLGEALQEPTIGFVMLSGCGLLGIGGAREEKPSAETQRHLDELQTARADASAAPGDPPRPRSSLEWSRWRFTRTTAGEASRTSGVVGRRAGAALDARRRSTSKTRRDIEYARFASGGLLGRRTKVRARAAREHGQRRRRRAHASTSSTSSTRARRRKTSSRFASKRSPTRRATTAASTLNTCLVRSGQKDPGRRARVGGGCW